MSNPIKYLYFWHLIEDTCSFNNEKTMFKMYYYFNEKNI